MAPEDVAGRDGHVYPLHNPQRLVPGYTGPFPFPAL